MARTMITLRLGNDGLEKVDQIAKDTASTRSVVIRVLLGSALTTPSVKKASVDRLMAMKETL